MADITSKLFLRLRHRRLSIITIFAFNSIFHIVWEVIKDYLLGDFISYVKTATGWHMNVVAWVMERPWLILAIISLGIVAWLLYHKDIEEALKDIRNTILKIQDRDRQFIREKTPIFIKHYQNEMARDALDLALLEQASGQRVTKNITPKTITNIRLKQLYPHNPQLEELKQQDKILPKLLTRLHSAQDEIMDAKLNWHIQRFLSVSNVYDTYYVMNKIVGFCYQYDEESMLLEKTLIKIERKLENIIYVIDKRIAWLLDRKNLTEIKRSQVERKTNE